MGACTRACRWYYDPKTEWYYGGDPQEWSQAPAGLAETARFEAAPHEGGPVASKIVGAHMCDTVKQGRAPLGAWDATKLRNIRISRLHPVGEAAGRQGAWVRDALQ